MFKSYTNTHFLEEILEPNWFLWYKHESICKYTFLWGLNFGTTFCYPDFLIWIIWQLSKYTKLMQTRLTLCLRLLIIIVISYFYDDYVRIGQNQSLLSKSWLCMSNVESFSGKMHVFWILCNVNERRKFFIFCKLHVIEFIQVLCCIISWFYILQTRLLWLGVFVYDRL